VTSSKVHVPKEARRLEADLVASTPYKHPQVNQERTVVAIAIGVAMIGQQTNLDSDFLKADQLEEKAILLERLAAY